MRSNLLSLGMCSAVAAVAVAGSANAGIVTKVDQFTTGQSFGSNSNYTTISGSIFEQRNARRYNNAGGTGVSGTNNNVAFTFARGGGSASSVVLNYQMSGAAAKNLSSIAEMSIALSGLNLNVAGGTAATGVKFNWTLTDSSDLIMFASDTRSTNGTSIFNFASATTDDGFDLTQVKTLSLLVSQVGGSESGTYSNTSSSGTLSNFSYTAAVPAPGAAALVGMAGLIASRRRKA